MRSSPQCYGAFDLSRFALSSLSPRRRTALDLLLLTLLCLLFFWRDLPWAGIDYRGFAAGDFGYQFYAFASYKAERLHAGQLPLWSPYALGGHPFLADIQSAVFYPLSLLTMLVTAVTGFSYAALQIEAILHFPIAAAGMYLLVRRLTASRLGAWVGAVTFAFSAFLTGYAVLQLAILETVAWVPWILLALDVGVVGLTRPGRRRTAYGWILLAGLLMGVALLAGHPQSAMFVFYGSIAYALFRYATVEGPGGVRPVHHIAAALLVFALVAGGIAAAQLLPSLEYMRLSSRAGLGIDAAGKGFTPYDLLQLVLPQVAVPFAALYVGALPLGLAIYALVQDAGRSHPATQSGRLTRYAAWLVLVCLLLSFGALTPVYHLAYLVAPGWRLFRQQERLAVWIVFGLALLAGLAAAALERWTSQGAQSSADAGGQGAGSRLQRGYGAAAAVAALFAAACFVGFVGGNDKLWGFAAAGLFLASMLVLAALAVRSRQPVWIVALIVLDLFTLIGGQHAGDAASAVVYPRGPVTETVTADTGIFRTSDEDVLPGHAGYGYGFEDTNGISPLRLGTYDRVLREAPKPLLWRLLGVKYVLTWRQELERPAQQFGEQPGKDGKPIYAYRLEDENPRAWFAGVALVEPDADRQLQKTLDAAFDPDRQVVLDRSPAPQPSAGCGGRIDWIARSPEHLSLRATADAPCVLVLSEIAYPGWQATVDGTAAPILTADGVLRGIALAEGEHTVELAFRPLSVTLGLVVSGATLAAVLAALVFIRRSSR